MIKTLKIKNVALVKDISLEFSQGFNVLLGETGAGKSIIIDALNFVLGDKPSKTMIRTGEEYMSVEASFSGYGKLTSLVLNKLGIEDEGVLFFSRVYTQSGKSECKVNGLQLPLSMLKQVSETLVDFYGQHENQLLLRNKNHLQILESYNPEIFVEDKKHIQRLLTELKDIRSRKQSLGGDNSNRERLIDLLTYQINEIENIAPKEQEDEALDYELRLFANSEKISVALNSSISSSSTALGAIKSSIHSLKAVETYNEKISSLIERFTSCLYELDDLESELKNQSAELVFDEVEMQKIDSRLDQIKSLKRKYGPTLEDVSVFLRKSKEELDNLANAEIKLNELSENERKIISQLYEYSKVISSKRRALASEVEKKIETELAELGMKNARIKISFSDFPECNEDTPFTSNGLDNVEFLFSANLGEELKSLSKTISGGEMSRFMLAMKNILADIDGVDTLVFDEVDTGISGNIGNAVAEKIARLSKHFQIICITHLPQVASMADSYIFVSKKVKDNATFTHIEKLGENRIIEQLATLIGGESKTELALAHAKELKFNSENFKKKIS